MQITHAYFAHSSKRHHEFTKLAALMEKKGNKILKQVKTRWISLLKPAKRIMQQYSVLVYNMHLDTGKVKAAEKTLESLVDVETLIGLACLVPLLKLLNTVSKFPNGATYSYVTSLLQSSNAKKTCLRTTAMVTQPTRITNFMISTLLHTLVIQI